MADFKTVKARHGDVQQHQVWLIGFCRCQAGLAVWGACAAVPSPLPRRKDLMTVSLAASDLNLAWIDLEMTGLDPDRDRIIEIAVIVTDPDLRVRIAGPVHAIHQSDATLDAMDAWNKGTHGKSGLIERVKASAVDEAEAET